MIALRSTVSRRRLLLAGGLMTLAVGLGACGNKVSHPTSADSEGVYVDAGQVEYQVQLSRELNPYDIEDHEYLSGVSATPPNPDQQWFAIFMWARNNSHSNQTTAGSFDIVDTQGNKYYPVTINSSLNPFAWTPQTLSPLGTEPAPNSIASFGPTQGAELLFKLSNVAYANRPLTLEIYASGQPSPSSVSLDL